MFFNLVLNIHIHISVKKVILNAFFHMYFVIFIDFYLFYCYTSEKGGVNMKRLIERRFIEWKNSANRKPLLIYGARQIGKTYSMIAFGKEYYTNTVYCNFESTSDLHVIFERDLDPERIVRAISTMYNTQITKGGTLIIFDEIQACERALTSLKYFQEQANDYHIVAAGSLLGLAVNRGHYSFPVGKVDMITMYPLSFEEFLLATDNEKLISLIKKAYSEFSPFALHEKAMDLYRTYLIVGGYPAAVQTYLDTSDFNAVRAEQSMISNAYIADMAKYATPSDMLKSIEVYNSLFAQLSKENTKFQYSVIGSKARARDYETALAWLKSANVVLRCQRVTDGKYPLALYEDQNSFKIYYSDVGLLTMRISIAPNAILQPYNLSDKARGMMAENYVAEQLTANGFSLHYWTSGNTAEIDFVIQQNACSIPVEVKSSDNVKAKSLQTYVKNYAPNYSIRVSAKNFGYDNGIKSIPLYAIFCLHPDET